MAAFNLYRANCIGNEWNCLYPHKVCAGDEESLRQAVCQDYVAVEYAKGYRSNENFIRTNCLALDCDNGHSENPEEWVSPEKILSLFPDVTVGFHFSRHHNLPKEGKSARPRFHCFFLIDEMTDPETYKNLKSRSTPSSRISTRRRWMQPASFTAPGTRRYSSMKAPSR